MRIAFVVGTFPELSETFILDQITGLLDLGHDVVVFGRAPAADSAAHPVVKQYRLLERARHWVRGMHTPLDVVARTLRVLPRHAAVMARSFNVFAHGSKASGPLWAYASKVLQEPAPFDVILAHFGTNGLIAQRLRDVGALTGPLVTVFHGHDLSKQLARHGPSLYGPLFAKGELMLPVSEFFARRLIELGCPRSHIQVQRMGVDTTRFALSTRTRADGEPTRLVSVCRLVEKKGIEFGLRAFAKAGTELRWDIVGDGPLRAQLERLSAELSLTERVRFHGARTRDGVQALLRDAHVFFAPSVTASDGDQEGVPVAIMEAAASGMPVISTRHSGIPELVHDGESGLLVDEWNEPQLISALREMASQPARWDAMGRAGQRVVLEQFDLQQLNRTLERRLREVL